MAYKTKIAQRCQKCGIKGRPAVDEVFNRVNGSMGYFCSQHADEEVKRLNKEDA